MPGSLGDLVARIAHDRVVLLQRARAPGLALDLFVHGVLSIFRWWELVVPCDGLPLSTLDDSFCFLWFLSH